MQAWSFDVVVRLRMGGCAAQGCITLLVAASGLLACKIFPSARLWGSFVILSLHGKSVLVFQFGNFVGSLPGENWRNRNGKVLFVVG